MPRQYDGLGTASATELPSESKTVPSSLRSYLDHRPPPRALTPGQITPTGIGRVLDDDGTPRPGRPRPDLNEQSEEEREDDYNNGYDPLDEDDEFEIHYSRRGSSASSTEDDEDDEEDDEEQEEDDAVEMNPATFNRRGDGEPIQRVSSLPTGLPGSNQTSNLHMSHSTTSLTRAAPPLPPPLYPPFYNRPPTPLPPSPSLTSLLRPPSLLNRSATSTRPTTPDSSDVETPATNDDTEAAVASSARRARPLAPTAPKVPTYEYYGFVLYLASTLAFLIYILWAYLPSPFLHAMGIRYYPNRWWALAVPSWIVMALIYTYVALACWNTEQLTLGLDSLETMVDNAGNVAILDDQGRVRKGGSKRYETEMEERQRRQKAKSTHGHGVKKKGASSGGKKKEKRRKDRDRDRARSRDDRGRFGYMGEVYQGRIAHGLSWQQIWNEGTDAVMDVPIGAVCEILYGEGDEFSS